MSTGSVNQKATWTVARVNALRHLDVELRKWPRRGWIAIAWGVTLALIGVAQRPTTDIDGYQGGSAAFWSLLILGGVIALFGVRRLALYRSTRRRQPEIAAVAQWCDDAQYHRSTPDDAHRADRLGARAAARPARVAGEGHSAAILTRACLVSAVSQTHRVPLSLATRPAYDNVITRQRQLSGK
jgi:hypothetical protein